MRFRDDYLDALLDALAGERRSVTGQAGLELEVFSAPQAASPFLTLGEWLEGPRDGLPWRVLKLLVVLAEDPSEPFWREVLEGERDRWRDELRRRLALPPRVNALALPLSVSREGTEGLVAIAELGPLSRRDLVAGALPAAGLRLSYLARPYVAWPRLADLGWSADQLRRRWELYCEDHGVAAHLTEPLFPHFCDEALTDGRGDVLLTSAWRLEFFR